METTAPRPANNITDSRGIRSGTGISRSLGCVGVRPASAAPSRPRLPNGRVATPHRDRRSGAQRSVPLAAAAHCLDSEHRSQTNHVETNEHGQSGRRRRALWRERVVDLSDERAFADWLPGAGHEEDESDSHPDRGPKQSGFALTNRSHDWSSQAGEEGGADLVSANRSYQHGVDTKQPIRIRHLEWVSQASGEITLHTYRSKDSRPIVCVERTTRCRPVPDREFDVSLSRCSVALLGRCRLWAVWSLPGSLRWRQRLRRRWC